MDSSKDTPDPTNNIRYTDSGMCYPIEYFISVDEAKQLTFESPERRHTFETITNVYTSNGIDVVVHYVSSQKSEIVLQVPAVRYNLVDPDRGGVGNTIRAELKKAAMNTPDDNFKWLMKDINFKYYVGYMGNDWYTYEILN
jgi:hypothetical protein